MRDSFKAGLCSFQKRNVFQIYKVNENLGLQNCGNMDISIIKRGTIEMRDFYNSKSHFSAGFLKCGIFYFDTILVRGSSSKIFSFKVNAGLEG